MSRAKALSVPPAGEGAMTRFLRSVRWAFGIVRLEDLSYRSDVELITLAEGWVRANKKSKAALALDAFSQRTTLDPKILQRYGDVSRLLGSHEAAIFSYLQAAELYVQQGIFTKAHALLQSLVRIYPDHVDTRLALGRVLEAMSRNKEAAANYAVVVKIFQTLGQVDAALPLLQKIAILWPQARSDYRAGVSPTTPNPEAAARAVAVASAAPAPPAGPRPSAPPAAAVAPKVVVGRPMRMGSVVAPDRDAGPLDLDLDSLIGEFAKDDEPPKDATMIASIVPELLEDEPTGNFQDGSETDRYRALDASPPTASYQAIDSGALSDGGNTLMDMRAVDASLLRAPDEDEDEDDGGYSGGSEATVMDMRAITDDDKAPPSRVIDKTIPTEPPPPPEPQAPTPKHSISARPRRVTTVKRNASRIG